MKPSRAFMSGQWSSRQLACWAFPIVLWLFATFALGGALGKSTDDYSTNLCDPVTGTLTHGFKPFAEYSYFWRPAHIVLIHGLQSYFYQSDRFIHAIGATAHGLVALLLFTLLRRVTGSSAAAGSAALIFLVVPIHEEAIFFTSTISTLIAASLLLWLSIAISRDAAAPINTRRRWHVVAMAVIALAIPFFYEQAGPCIAALPLLWWGASSRSEPLGRSLARPLAITTLLLSMQGFMLMALFASAPSGRRGSGSSIRDVVDWPQSFATSVSRTLDLIAGQRAGQLMAGGFTLGREMLTTTVLWVWIVPLSLTAAAFMLTTWRSRAKEHADDLPLIASAQRSIFLMLFGLAAAALALVPPSIVSGQGIAARLTYIPLVGLCISLGGGLAFAQAHLAPRGRHFAIGLLCPILVILTIAAAVTLVGSQRWFQLRARADVEIAQQLRRLFADPPPGAIFVPVRIDQPTTRTGQAFFDHLRPGAFETIWSSTALIRQTYQRRDLWAAGRNPWRQPTIDQPTESGVRLNDRFVIWSPFPPMGGGTFINWDQIVPFCVNDKGRVQLVRQFVFHDWLSEPRPIEPALVRRQMRAKRLHRSNTEIEYVVAAASPISGEPIAEWHRNRLDGTLVTDEDLAPRSLWGMTAPAIWLHPSAEAGSRTQLSTHIPAGPARRVLLYATFAGFDLDRLPNAGAIKLTLSSPSGLPATLVIDPSEFRRTPRWLPVTLDLPASSSATEFHIQLNAAGPSSGERSRPANSEQSSNDFAPLWVTRGVLIPIETHAGGGSDPANATQPPQP